jgi:hypothetical protein
MGRRATDHLAVNVADMQFAQGGVQFIEMPKDHPALRGKMPYQGMDGGHIRHGGKSYGHERGGSAATGPGREAGSSVISGRDRNR